ncbi:MAG: restriction endonuclease subunit S [Luteolibacter sp.]
MSSKAKTTATKKEAVPALVPKLRFPGFQNVEEWEIAAIGQLADYENGKAYEQDIVENGKYVVVNSRFISTDGAVRKYTNAEHLIAKAGEVLMVLSDLPKGRALAKCYFVESDHYYAVNQRVCRLKPSRIDGKFLFYTLNRHPRLLAYDDGLNQTHLSKGGVTECPLCVPPKKPEQQKIAECLTTLDEVIAGQSQKLDALKTHKKGLMQQLFPREGETLPRLRFPEFQAAPEWESDSLGNIFDTTSGGTPSRSKKNYWDGNIPWITTSLVNFGVINEAVEFISEDGLKNSSAKLFPEGTVLIAMYGQGKTRGQVALLGLEAATNQACAAVLPHTGIEPYFVFLNLAGRYEELRDLSNSGGQENLSQGLIRALPFSYPSDGSEQKKITSCLKSLDDLITAQGAKLEALKTHKKGLMQQLFPSPEEVEA